LKRQSCDYAFGWSNCGHDAVHQLAGQFWNHCRWKCYLALEANGKWKSANADLVVGADGIRSSLWRLPLGNDISPLRYLGCIAILEFVLECSWRYWQFIIDLSPYFKLLMKWWIISCLYT
jgi:hypothetical protein